MARSDIKNIIIITLTLLCVNLCIYIYINKDNTSSNAPTTSQEHNNSHSTTTNTIDNGTTHKEFPFDPNTADSATFVKLGLTPRVARAIIHYRQAGGIFRNAEDFSKIYTLKPADYQRLKSYIKIDTQFKQIQQEEKHDPKHFTEQPNRAQSSNKLIAGQTVNITTADTTILMRIPGIGPYYARKIIRYRERLGGFVSTAQLREITGLPDDIEQWATVGKQNQSVPDNTIKRLLVNHLTFSQLLAHPYLNYEQTKVIVNHRHNFGNIQNIEALSNYNAFSADDIKRLTPYLDFSF